MTIPIFHKHVIMSIILLFNLRSSSMIVALASTGAKRTFGGRTPAAPRRPKKFSESSKRVSLMMGTKTDCLD